MSLMKKKKIFSAFFIALPAVVSAFVLTLVLTTCDMPMGMGNPIDWEPPVLTLEPVPPNPMYVRNGAILSGTVTDNISVDRVIVRDAATLEELGRAKISGEKWEIVMEFSEEQNEQMIAGEIVAFDRAGNSGEQSIFAITLYVDLRPPVVEDSWIQRSELRRADFEPYGSLKELETHDPRGERSENANRYQNGVFTITGQLAENETRIDIVSLKIFDSNDSNNALLELPKIETTNNFSPRWLVSEEALLDAGEAMGWANYKYNYYNTNTRYYYRVVVTAYDRSENESEYHENFFLPTLRVEDQGFFCMWQNADIPKGIVDPLVAGTSKDVVVTKGATLPVVFFDDDQLLWAYAGLVRLTTWNTISGSSDEDKLIWLKNTLNGGTVYTDWNGKAIVDLAKNIEINEVTYAVPTGNNDTDTGQFVLFSLVADRKLPPHPSSAAVTAPDTYKTRERLEKWNVDVIDENEPLIVFDTIITTSAAWPTSPGNDTVAGAKTGDSPEENTFPKLTGGSTFEINGYTMRANKLNASLNTVTKFRMAWIPYNDGQGEDLIPAVQKALASGDYPTAQSGGSMADLETTYGVQHWNFSLITGSNMVLDLGKPNEIFTKQVFRKKFSVLPGQSDDIKPSLYNNFTIDKTRPASEIDGGTHENAIKLFVFYAEDNMGHVVFRQLRLLGNKTPPEVSIYDLTKRNITVNETPPNSLPDLNNTDNSNADFYFYNGSGIIDSDGRGRYEAKRLEYQSTGYGLLSGSIGGEALKPEEIALVNAAYPRNTIIKYWVTAVSNGDLAVESIIIRDITFPGGTNVGSFNNTTTPRSLSYVEKLSEVTQRVFMIEATDSLKNVARIQRTVAVTNAAVLNNITTTTQSGDYGIGEKVTIKANFSNLVKWTTNGNANSDIDKPKLNLRLRRGAIYSDYNTTALETANMGGTSYLIQLPTITPANTDSLSLDFEYTIQEGDAGILETMYNGISNTPTPSDINQYNRPIVIPSRTQGATQISTQILDSSRGDSAFTPRNSEGYDWTGTGAITRSLQGGKQIKPRGVRPRLIGFQRITTKPASTLPPPGDFFIANETIEFMITADKAIYTGAIAPVIGFRTGSTTATLRNAAWSRSGTTAQMIFGVIINNTNTPEDGQILRIQLNNSSSIVDQYGNAISNALVNTAGVYTAGAYELRSEPDGDDSNNFYLDKISPTAPTVNLTATNTAFYDDDGANAPISVGQNATVANRVIYYRYNPQLTIEGQGGETIGSVIHQYSLDGGSTWVNIGTEKTGWTTVNNGITSISNGNWTLAARIVDRAGNTGAVRSQKISVNAEFPSLQAITTESGNGYYKQGDTIKVVLNFTDRVWTSNRSNVSITLRNRSALPNPDPRAGKPGAVTHTYEQVLTGTQVENIANRNNAKMSVEFTWAVSGKEMPEGLYVYAANFAGLSDRFGNPGQINAGSTSSIGGELAVLKTGGYTQSPVTNLNGIGIKVDCFAPDITTRTPENAAGLTGNRSGAVSTNNTTITLLFDEPVQKGRGTITVRPHGNYAIPPVLENTGYYLAVSYNGTGQTETVTSSVAANSTYVYGMNDIYNNMTGANAATDRGYLITSGTLAEPYLNQLTGLSAGPYKKMTHGLTRGAGYTGNYSNVNPAAPAAPGRDGTNFMIPDTTTKWVLDYQYQIHDATANSAVSNIRAALNRMGFRRQNIAVTLPAVNVTGSTVIITLPEPLLPGLQWGVFYPEGTFTDMAGNSVAASGADLSNSANIQANSPYWFWSKGIQKPVIRVNRKSSDIRSTVPIRTSGDTSTQTYNTAGYSIGGARGNTAISEFLSIHYRIETETPTARIFYTTKEGSTFVTSIGTGTESSAAPLGSITADWGTTRATLSGVNNPNYEIANNLYWGGSRQNNQTVGTWIRPNLVFRNRNNGEARPYTYSYTVTEMGSTVEHAVRGANNYYGFRSFNKDITSDEFSALNFGTASYEQAREDSFTYTSLQASKNYVTAEARVDHINGTYTSATHISPRGYEGVFRTVIALDQSGNNTGNANILICGSNIKSGIPTIAGFPLKDGVANSDTRYLKVFFKEGSGRYYWVSSEIVTPWYLQQYGSGTTTGNGGSYGNAGDSWDWITAGYGDLSYAYSVQTWGNN